MEWKNAAKADLPKNGQEVLIAVNDKKFVAEFNASARSFVVKNGPVKTFFLKDHVIYWTEIKKQSN